MKQRVIISIVIVAVLFTGAILLWAIKTGKIAMFAAEEYKTALISVRGQANWDLGEFKDVLVSPVDGSIFLDTGAGLPEEPQTEPSASPSASNTLATTSTPTGSATATVTDSSPTPSSSVTVTESTPTETPSSESPNPTSSATANCQVNWQNMPSNIDVITEINTEITINNGQWYSGDDALGPIIMMDNSEEKIIRPKKIVDTKTNNTKEVFWDIPVNEVGKHKLQVKTEIDFDNTVEYTQCQPEREFEVKAPLQAYLNINPSSIYESDYINISGGVHNFSGEFTNSNSFLKIFGMFFPHLYKIKPFSFNPGNYAIQGLFVVYQLTPEEKTLTTEENLTINPNSIQPICDSSGVYCELNKTKVLFDQNFNDDETVINTSSYTKYYANLINRLSPEIYQTIHFEDKNLDSEDLIDKIPIQLDLNTTYAAYTHIRFENKIGTDDDLRRGIYMGKLLFNYPDLQNDSMRRLYYSDKIAGMVVHELGHFLKIPKTRRENLADTKWIEEGIADYVRHILGYDVVSNNTYPHCTTGQTYLNGYMCAADFFIFIKEKYNKDIPKQFVKYQEEDLYSNSYEEFVTGLFSTYVGKDVNTIWDEYKVSRGLN